MSKQTLIFLSLISLCLLPLSSPLPPTSLLNAAEILSNSGYVSMSLTLQLISPSLITTTTTQQTSQSPPQSATIFSPSDAAFAVSGQPSLSLLHLHISPIAFSLDSLRSLPYSTPIPTLSSSNSLFITTPNSNSNPSLNNVSLSASPLYDDGSLIIFAIDSFFNPHFLIPPPHLNHFPNPTFFPCLTTTTTSPSFNPNYSFAEASRTMRSKEYNYSVMATCLDLQLVGPGQQQPNMTVFAPVDDVVLSGSENLRDYVAVFRRHVVAGCRMTWRELREMEEGVVVVLRTFEEGVGVGVGKVGGEVLVNGVPVAVMDMYRSEWLVVHGLARVSGSGREAPETSPGYGGGGEERMGPDRNEF